MADQKPEEVQDEAKGGGIGKLVIILVGINTLLVAGLAVLLIMTRPSEAPKEPEGQAAAAQPSKEDMPGPQFQMRELTVNLADASGDRFLRCRVVLELSGPELEKELKARENQIRDRVIAYLSSLRFEDTQGIAGKEEIRRGIRSRINALLNTGQVKAVYFSDFVVQ